MEGAMGGSGDSVSSAICKLSSLHPKLANGEGKEAVLGLSVPESERRCVRDIYRAKRTS